MEDDHRLWGLSLSLSLPDQHPPSPSPSPPCPHPHPPLPIEFIHSTTFPHGHASTSTLSSTSFLHHPPSTPLQPNETIRNPNQDEEQEGSLSSPTRALNNDNIEPLFPWTSKHATIHTMQYLTSHDLTTIIGKVKCIKCSIERDIRYNLVEKFVSVANFIVENKSNMNHRAPSNWENPVLPNCESCGKENCMNPVISNNNEGINWLFLLLGEMIGCCNLKHLKYFCKHMNIHSSGAKNRLIYYTYLSLCKQLDPNGPFDP